MSFSAEQEQQARQKIRLLRAEQDSTNWAIPPEYAAKAFEIAEIARHSPAQALVDAGNFIEGLRKRNLIRQTKLTRARKLRSDLIALEEERKPGQPKKSVPTTAPDLTGGFWGWLSRWLNGSSAPKSETVQKDVDDAALQRAHQAGENADKGLMAAIPDAATAPVAPVGPKKSRGCLGALFFWRRSQTAQSAADPNDHGLPLPLTNAGARGWQGLLQRWLLTSLNATPTSGLNWMEVTKNGLQIYQPLATVSQRAIKHNQVRDGQVVLSVNPPAYFDSLLGLLRQFRRDIDTPWGEIVIYEGGSGRVIASAIALAPGRRLKEIRTALELLHLAENEAEGFRRIPHLRDLFIYVEDDLFADDDPDDEMIDTDFYQLP